MNRLTVLLAIPVLLMSSARLVRGQSDCDPSVRGDATNPDGYRQRGDRCEGLYWRPHALEAGISIAGFRRGTTVAMAALPNSVRLIWNRGAAIPPNAQVSVKSVLLRSDAYYRMDANKAYSTGSFDWSTDVLRALHLDLKDLGMFASTSAKIGEVMWQVYLPLEVGSSESKSSTYEVTLIPGTALVDLSWRCSKVGPDGIPAKKLSGLVLKRQFPAGDPIRLEITVPQYEGFSYVEISGDALSPYVTEPLHADFTFFASH